MITNTLDAKHNKSQGCYQWLWSGIPSFSGSLIASEKWAKKETHSYWQWCSQLNSNASYLSHFVLWQQKKSCLIYFQICPPRSACHPLRIVYWKKNYKYYEPEGSQNGRSKVIMSEIDCVSVQLGALLSTQVSCLFGSLLQYNQAARKWRNAWSQLLVWWSKFFFCKIKRFFA